MNNELGNQEPTLMEKVELIRTLHSIVMERIGKEVCETAEKKLVKLLDEL